MAILGKAVKDYRYGMMRDLMDREKVDALAFITGDFFQFVTNYRTDVAPWERPLLCVVPRNGEPFAVMCELSQNHWRFSTESGKLWVSEVSFYAEHVRTVDRLPMIYQLPALIADILTEKGLSHARIGVDGGGGVFEQAASLLPGLQTRVMGKAMQALRWVKHPDEIEVMRALCEFSDWVQDRYREAIRPGRLVREMDMSMAALAYEEGARRFPGEDLELAYFYTLSGPASAAPHGDDKAASKRIEKGEVLVNIVCPRLNGLFIENERTWFCGKPSGQQAAFFEAARAATEAGNEAAVTGAPVSNIDAASQAVFERLGFAQYSLHRTGHGMGIGAHEYPEDMAFNYRPLQTGEVYSVEPGIYIWGVGGFRHDDTVVVGETPEVLTKAPMDIKNQTVL